MRTPECVLLRQINKLLVRRPHYGSRRVAAMLRHEGQTISRKRVQRLMRVLRERRARRERMKFIGVAVLSALLLIFAIKRKAPK